MLSIVKLPSLLTVWGAIFLIYGLINIIVSIKDGYYRGVSQLIIRRICSWSGIVVLILTLLMIYSLDLKLSNWSLHHYNFLYYNFWDLISSLSEGGVIAGILLFLALILNYFKQLRMATVLQISFMALIYAGVLNAILKFIFNRARPLFGMDPHLFFHYFLSKNMQLNNLLYAYNSMPSGHTITIVAAMTPLFLAARSLIVKILAGVLAILVIIARIYTLNHWGSDILVASFLGLVVGLSIYQNNLHRIND